MLLNVGRRRLCACLLLVCLGSAAWTTRIAEQLHRYRPVVEQLQRAHLQHQHSDHGPGSSEQLSGQSDSNSVSGSHADTGHADSRHTAHAMGITTRGHSRPTPQRFKYTREPCVSKCLGAGEAPAGACGDCALLSAQDARHALTDACSVADAGAGAKAELTACTLSKRCLHHGSSRGACDVGALVAAACRGGKPRGLGGLCKDLAELCPANGDAPLSSACPSLPRAMHDLPSASAAASAAAGACASMAMSGCEGCAGPDACPHPVSRLVRLCSAMPGMPQCDLVSGLCDRVARLGSGHDVLAAQEAFGCVTPRPVPKMQMYFHGGVEDYLLFQSWVPASSAEFYAALAAIVLFALASARLKIGRHLREEAWAAQPLNVRPPAWAARGSWLGVLPMFFHLASHEDKVIAADAGLVGMNQLIVRNLERGLRTLVITCIDYGLMLVAMTFNVGFFAAVVGGIALAQVLYGHEAKK